VAIEQTPTVSAIPRDSVVLLTGASTGIGLALARTLSTSQYLRVILTARQSSLQRLEQAGFVESDRLWMRPLDVTHAAQRQAIVEEIDERLGGVDVLINNAGVAYRSVTEHIDPAETIDQLTTNYLGPMDLARLVMPRMRSKRRGRIINISSVSGMMAMPTMGAYSASKFALEGASESLWYEMRPWNIRVTLVQPGFIHSSSFQKVVLSKQAIEAKADPDDPYHAIYAAMEPFIEALMARAFATPEDIARRVVATLQQNNPRLRIFATIDARFFYVLRRLLPRKIFHALLYRWLPDVRNWGPRN
jgi:NAD(P)-dependent dehydrogenase (short-subunit alcohol dehydrogenase family)